jgi:hypothetical protein
MGFAERYLTQFDTGRQNRDIQAINRLTGQALSDPSQAAVLIPQIAERDAGTALKLRDSFQGQEDRKLARQQNFASIYSAAPPEARPLLQQRYAADFGFDPADPDFDRVVGAWATGASTDTSLPSSVREAMAFRDNPELLETRRQMYGSYSYGEVPLGDGTTAQTRRNSRTGMMEMVLPGGQVVPMAGATPASGQPQAEYDYAPERVSAPQPGRYPDAMVIPEEEGRDGMFNDLPPQLRAQAEQYYVAGQPFHIVGTKLVPGLSPGVQSEPPQRQTLDRVPMDQIGGGAMPPRVVGRGFGRTPEAEAAAVEAAKRSVGLQYAPAEAAAEAAKTSEVTGSRLDAEADAKSRAEAPKSIAAAEMSIALLDKAIKHPGREVATGASSMFDPRNLMPGSPARDFRVLLNQLQGRAFLQAFESLKGGGQISNIEGIKAEQAMARLDAAQSEEEFVASLRELKEIAQAGLDRARQQVGGQQASPQRTAAGPQPGQVEDGYRYKGGDPADPNSWERI